MDQWQCKALWLPLLWDYGGSAFNSAEAQPSTFTKAPPNQSLE